MQNVRIAECTIPMVSKRKMSILRKMHKTQNVLLVILQVVIVRNLLFTDFLKTIFQTYYEQDNGMMKAPLSRF